MKSAYSKRIIVLFVGILLIAVYIYNCFIFFPIINNSTNIVIIKRVYDEKGNIYFDSKHLNFDEKSEFQIKLKNQYLFYLYQTDAYYGLPYLPITEYEIYFENSNKSDKTIQLLENGSISSGYTIYYSFDSIKLFKLIDDFYSNLK